MFTSVELTNYRCFPSLKVELKPLTVLIGENDTGKSALLEALRNVKQFTMSEEDGWMRTSTPRVRCLFSHDGGVPVAVELSRNAGVSFRTEDPRLRQHMSAIEFYRLPSKGLDLVSGGYDDSAGQPPAIDENGDMIPAYLDYLLRRHRTRFDAVVASLRDRVPGLSDVHIASVEKGGRRLRVDVALKDSLVLPADRLSVGLRVLLFYIAIMHHPSPPTVMLIEEPENGVHPKRLREIMDLLRGITKGEHTGRPAQVIISTHSPFVLDCVNLDEDQVLVFRRNDDGSRTAEPVDAERLKPFLDDFLLGEIWYNRGEEGLIRKGTAS